MHYYPAISAPEFGTITMKILGVTIVGSILFAFRSKVMKIESF